MLLSRFQAYRRRHRRGFSEPKEVSELAGQVAVALLLAALLIVPWLIEVVGGWL